ncbi:MAG: hypothetical protein AAGM45_01575 [Cyanobacteria bacterium J06588_5]
MPNPGTLNPGTLNPEASNPEIETPLETASGAKVEDLAKRLSAQPGTPQTRKVRYLLFSTLFGSLIGSLIGSLSWASYTSKANAAFILGEPSGEPLPEEAAGQSSSIENLADGNYRFCNEQPFAAASRPFAESNSRDGEPMGACFRFRKQGTQIIGDYYYPTVGSSVCLSGLVDGNVITGEAIERAEGSNAVSQTEGNISAALQPWRRAGFLQVSAASTTGNSSSASGITHYPQAVLTLNDFYRYNAGSVASPINCSTQSRYPLSVTSDQDRRIALGTSSYFNQPVYLNVDTVETAEESTYTYTTFVGVSALLSETDYRVSCEQGEIQVLQSRTYDRDGDLNGIEHIKRSVSSPTEMPTSLATAAPAPAIAIRPDEASRYVCQEFAQVELPGNEVSISAPEDVAYKRYRSDRFNYAVLYPADLLSLQDNTGGQVEVFRNEANSILLRIYGIRVAAPDSLARRYEQASTGRNVTYRIIEADDFFVVSGTDDGQVFYQKTYLEDGVFKVLELQYDEELRQVFGPIARVIGDSFAPVRDRLRISQIPPAVQSAVIEKSARKIEAESAIFEIVSASQQIWPDGCLGIATEGEACTQALVPGWQIRLEAEVAGSVRTFTYRTDETGDVIRFEP